MFEVFKKAKLWNPLLCLALCAAPLAAQKANVVTTTPYTGFSAASGIAVDASGNVYVANSGAADLVKDPGTTTLDSGLAYPQGVAVDIAGYAYVTDYSGHLYKVPVAGGTAVDLLAAGNCPMTVQYYVGPSSVAVDGSNNVYVVGQSGTGPPPNTSGEYIYEITAAGVCSVRLDESATGKDLRHIASDAAGNLTFSFNGGAVLYSLPAGATTATALTATFSAINGLRADKYGNVFITDASTIDEIPFDTVAGALAPARMQAVLQNTSQWDIGIGPGGALYTTDGTSIFQYVRASVAVVGSKSLVSVLNQTGDVLEGAVGTSETTGTLGGLAFDTTGNTRSVTSGDNVLTTTAPGASTSSTVSGGGLSAPVAVAVDGGNNTLVANSTGASFSVFTDAGVAVTGTSGFGSASLTDPSAIAIDMSGGVWITNAKSGAASVTHILGGAYPIITPLVSGVASGKLGVQP